MEKVLIIGGAGFIGSNLAEKLIKRGYQVFVYDNFSSGQITNLKFLGNAQIIKGDILNYGEISNCIKKVRPNTIFHLAAIHYIPDCNKDPKKTYKVNVGGTHNILKAVAALNLNTLFVFISSAAVYANSQNALKESDKTLPICIYGKTKLLGEKMTRKICEKRQIPFVIIRLFNVYGPNDGIPHVIPRIIAQIKRRRKNIELGNLQPKRDFIYVDDVSDALYKILTLKPKGKIYNLGTGKEYSIRNITDRFIKILQNKNLRVVIKQNLLRRKERLNLKADIAKIRKELRWRPKISINRGIKMLLKKEGLL
jgi:UDP-glucose 4-epimerase